MAQKAKGKGSKNGPQKRSAKNQVNRKNRPADDPRGSGSRSMGRSTPKGGMNPSPPDPESPPCSFGLPKPVLALPKPGPQNHPFPGSIFSEIRFQFGLPFFPEIARNIEK